MKIKVIGTGAAGNKAAIAALATGIIGQEQVMLLNSTLKDLPAEYKDKGIKLGESFGGCGKERAEGRNLTLGVIQSGALDDALDKFIAEDDELVIITASTEGGTGSGSSPILAKYISSTYGIKVMLFGFTGFEEDGRGIKNTIDWFKEVEEDFTVQVLSNKKFLKNDGNILDAEKEANKEFVTRLSVIAGYCMIDSEQNIDETDMYKATTTEGYMIAGRASLEKVKNIDQFNSVISKMIHNDKSLDVSEKGMKRLAVFINATDEKRECIDLGFEMLKKSYGTPYEIFKHIQHNPEDGQYISFIASGMHMPSDELKSIYDKYLEERKKINTNKDNFFNLASELNNELTADTTDMFDVKRPARRKKSKDDFLASMNIGVSRIEVASDINYDEEEV